MEITEINATEIKLKWTLANSMVQWSCGKYGHSQGVWSPSFFHPPTNTRWFIVFNPKQMGTFSNYSAIGISLFRKSPHIRSIIIKATVSCLVLLFLDIFCYFFFIYFFCIPFSVFKLLLLFCEKKSQKNSKKKQ